MTNPFKSTVPSNREIAKQTKELLNPEPTELQKKIESLKTNGCKNGIDNTAIWGKHNPNFDQSKSL